jgi:hypothetical protein
VREVGQKRTVRRREGGRRLGRKKSGSKMKKIRKISLYIKP